MFPPRRVVAPELMQQLLAKQNELKEQVVISPLDDSKIEFIAGCDTAITDTQVFSVIVVFKYAELDTVEISTSYSQIPLPYIPGFLAFREVPNIVLAYEKLKQKPDIIMVDGHGIAHPRQMGIASHLGVTLNAPTIGVAKSKLVGEFEPLELEQGSTSPLIYKDEEIAVVLRSRAGVNPIFVSPGHLCDMPSAMKLVLNTLHGHKLPEPTFIADKLSKSMKESLGVDSSDTSTPAVGDEQNGA